MRPAATNDFALGLSDLEQRVQRPLLDQCEAAWAGWMREGPRDAAQSTDAGRLEFLKAKVVAEMGAIAELRRLHAQFIQAVSSSPKLDDQRQFILKFARDLGATSEQLEKDAAAFARWFGADAMTDRYRRKHARHEQYAAFLLGRLAALAERAAAEIPQSADQAAFWISLQLETIIKPILVHDGDPRLNLAAFRCLADVLSALAPEIQETVVDDATLQYIYRSALQHQQQVWIQCAALELLVTLSWPSFERALQQRLLQPAGGDDIFLRRKAVQLLAAHYGELGSAETLVGILFRDPSAYVRQLLPKVIVQAPNELAEAWLKRLVTEDASPQVRAAAWLEWPELIGAAGTRRMALAIFREAAGREQNEFVLRVICTVAERTAEILAAGIDRGSTPAPDTCVPPADARTEWEAALAEWAAGAREVLVGLRCASPSLKVRRWASQSLEFIWAESQPRLRELRRGFAAFAAAIPRGKSRRVPPELTDDLDPAVLGRLWAVVCQRDYDIQLQAARGGYKAIRGHVFGFRWWRWWHEFRHPSPDKRQAFPHTIGRLFDGELQVPSGIMAELAQTKVPGEPLHMADEGGWRPYLPLVDQLTSSVELGRPALPLRIFTSEGTTTVTPPRGWKRWRAVARLTWRFRQYAEKRNWLESMQEPANAYVRALRDLGFRIRFEPYPDETGRSLPADPMVARFFPAMVLPVSLTDTWDRFGDYFVSLYQNSLTELAVFVLGFGALFFALHLLANSRLKYWRKRIPLVIGGWGTRGKSGTERLKAALFNALGLGVVSKTTGCEAMFLQAYPFGEMKEMFLFRPYDKATIWEQLNVVRLAGRLKTDVMLWECMGLTPSYVKILQRHWMRDEFATITNTYPDHEDLQGPAGINIPEVIGCFIPEKSTLITSEEQMLPILASEAEQRKTSVHPVTWLEAGLIAPDVLQRFPYEEHPYNIALVLGLAERLGIDRDFALKEMADRVVPDLGVLKTYPVATVRTRRLEFTNGMSANERFGTISNWLRTGFDRQDYVKEPGVWLTTVVNNRADRVPRSQVFARILVNDLSADRHVLIGGNLNGLLGYIREAWAEKAPTLSLWKDPARPDPAGALAVLEHQAVLLRLPIQPGLIREHLRAMLAAQTQVTNLDELLACWEDPDLLQSKLTPLELGEIQTAILDHLRLELRTRQEYAEFAERIRQSQPSQAAALDQQFRDLLQQWFQAKIVVVEDYYATGNQIVELIARRTPPGFLNRVMGIQNIKGTGLDFVYRWQAWQACYNATQPLRTNSGPLTPQSLAPLAAFQDYGVLCAEHVREVVERAKQTSQRLSPEVVQELDRVLDRLNAAMTAIDQQSQSGGGTKNGWLVALLTRIEEFLDAGDAVRRRTQADRIYEDLIAERISRERAVAELQALTQRQKGGWLLKKLCPSG